MAPKPFVEAGPPHSRSRRPASPAASAGWDRADLIRRVVHSLAFADRAIAGLSDADFEFGSGGGVAGRKRAVIGEKVVAETAMLLHCVAPIRHCDTRIHHLVAGIAAALNVRARDESVLAAICLDPGHALDHAVAHILLGHLGCPDPGVDELLAASLALGPDFGPERLPHRRLEQQWLGRVWGRTDAADRTNARLLKESVLARPLDALGCDRLDIYAFTHTVMYASDLGERRVALPRKKALIGADAIPALACAVGSADYDLTAEVLLTWPMLGLPWNPVAAFAFRLLADVEDELGFLPGLNFDVLNHRALPADMRSDYELWSCYHAVYVMGFLCAAALRADAPPPAVVPLGRDAPGATRDLLRLFDTEACAPRWRESLDRLSTRQQDGIAPLLLAILLRRARAKGELRLVRAGLETALRHALTDGAAPSQAAALLRRSQWLDRDVPDDRVRLPTV